MLAGGLTYTLLHPAGSVKEIVNFPKNFQHPTLEKNNLMLASHLGRSLNQKFKRKVLRTSSPLALGSVSFLRDAREFSLLTPSLNRIFFSGAEHFTPFTNSLTSIYSEKNSASPLRMDENLVENSVLEPVYPLSIENVLNSYQKRKSSKTSIQIYFTPTISYRKLQEHKNIIQSSVPLGISSYQSSMYNINNAVTQKPDIGFEIGMALKHAVVRNVKLKAGLQLNVNRYDVKVFNTPSQLSTIQLNNNNNPNYLNTPTNYSNFNGIHSDWLQNFYIQMSAPVGLEIKIKGDDNIQFGIASTIQPTYILGYRAYLISSDYKTYAQVPGLLRHTNVNTSFETFVSYSTHRYTWQVGPEVRYQLFSSFVPNYSIKEHLLDFGLKIGISPLK
ncbi:MAG: hypothetical protein NVS9B7_25890 [Flavisolibacter sp.]